MLHETSKDGGIGAAESRSVYATRRDAEFRVCDVVSGPWEGAGEEVDEGICEGFHVVTAGEWYVKRIIWVNAAPSSADVRRITVTSEEARAAVVEGTNGKPLLWGVTIGPESAQYQVDEVEPSDVWAAAEDKVGGLDVAVDDPLLVDVLDHV